MLSHSNEPHSWIPVSHSVSSSFIKYIPLSDFAIQMQCNATRFPMPVGEHNTAIRHWTDSGDGGDVGCLQARNAALTLNTWQRMPHGHALPRQTTCWFELDRWFSCVIVVVVVGFRGQITWLGGCGGGKRTRPRCTSHVSLRRTAAHWATDKIRVVDVNWVQTLGAAQTHTTSLKAQTIRSSVCKTSEVAVWLGCWIGWRTNLLTWS